MLGVRYATPARGGKRRFVTELSKDPAENPAQCFTIPAPKPRKRKIVNHAQPGDPAKLATAILALVGAEQPPLRLPLGTDTVALIERKNRSVTDELARWRSLSLSTDFAPGAA
jgi:hypothetical protein